MNQPLIPSRIFLGAALTGDLYRFGVAATDLGQPVPARWRSQRYAGDGQGGEVMFRGLAFTARYTGACSVRVTPTVDNVAYDAIQLDLPQPTVSEPTAYRKMLVFSQPYLVAGIDIGRVGLRGCWVQASIALVTAIAPDVDGNVGKFWPEGVELDIETVDTAIPKIASPVV